MGDALVSLFDRSKVELLINWWNQLDKLSMDTRNRNTNFSALNV